MGFLSEERLEKLENMMIDMLRIVGNTNALVEELKQELGEVKAVQQQHLETLGEHSEILKEHSEALQEHSEILREMMFKMDNIKPIEQMLGEHEIAIRNIRNRII